MCFFCFSRVSRFATVVMMVIWSKSKTGCQNPHYNINILFIYSELMTESEIENDQNDHDRHDRVCPRANSTRKTYRTYRKTYRGV